MGDPRSNLLSYVKNQKELLELERDEEKREAVEAGTNIPPHVLESAGVSNFSQSRMELISLTTHH